MFKVVLSTTGDMATYLDATDEVPTSTARIAQSLWLVTSLSTNLQSTYIDMI